MTVRRAAALAVLAIVAGLAGAPAALAAPPAVTPAAVHLRTPITVAWRAAAAGSYDVTMTVRPTPGPGLACSYGASAPPRQVARGALLRVTLRPQGDGAALSRKWCPGRARVTIRRSPPGFKPATVIAKRGFTVSRAPGELPPGLSHTPASIRLLPGSTISVAAAGHPDRTAPVRGVLRGGIPSPFRLGDEIHITRADGGLLADGLPADPRCPTVASLSTLSTTAELRLPPSGPVALTVTVGGTGAPPATCAASGFASWSSTIPLTGTIGPPGLLALRLNGAADGIALSLLVQVDLSGRR